MTIKLGTLIQQAPAATASALVSADIVPVSRGSDSLTLGLPWSQLLQQAAAPVSDMTSVSWGTRFQAPQTGSDSTTITAGNIPDLSGNGNNPATVNNVLLRTGANGINGKNAMQFTRANSSEVLTLTGAAGMTGDFYVACYVQVQGNLGVTLPIWSFGDPASTTAEAERSMVVYSDSFFRFSDNTTAQENGVAAANTPTNYLVELMFYSGVGTGVGVGQGTVIILINGQYYGFAYQESQRYPRASFVSTVLRLGVDAAGANFATMKLGEIVFLPRLPKAFEQSTVYNHGISFYGLSYAGGFASPAFPTGPLIAIGDSSQAVAIGGGSYLATINGTGMLNVFGPIVAQSIDGREHSFKAYGTNNAMNLCNSNQAQYSAIGYLNPTQSGIAATIDSLNAESAAAGVSGIYGALVAAPSGEYGFYTEFSDYGGTGISSNYSLVHTYSAGTFCRFRIDRATGAITLYAQNPTTGAAPLSTQAAIQVSKDGAVSVMGCVTSANATRTTPILKLRNSAGVGVGNVGGVVFDHYGDVTTTSTSGAFDTLYSDTFSANSFVLTGDKFRAIYVVTVKSSATANRDFRVVLGATTIFDSSSITFASAATVTLKVDGIADTTSTFRTVVEMIVSGITQNPLITYTPAVSGTFNSTNILKLTAAAGGTGAAAGDVTAKMGIVELLPSM